MHMLKLLFQKLQIKPILAPRRDSWPPGAPLKITAWGTSGGIRAMVFQGETDDTPLPQQLAAQGENVVVF